MRILHAMDQLLSEALAAGRQPKHWVIREPDWLEMIARLKGVQLEDEIVVARSYRSIPIQHASLHDEAIVGLVDTTDSKTEALFT
ncbi:hypothetical protein [Sphingobium sp. WCS2017Hpa-17]|uniref:hypothetical protein n=1 Tax=Sphingobium sp. WCS2017Hpa-17 TaxID=3073638 RepID=UPI002889059A|nr:hypothetical protein [Sphingobium sp. WCS2017Hpa-17]